MQANTEEVLEKTERGTIQEVGNWVEHKAEELTVSPPFMDKHTRHGTCEGKCSSGSQVTGFSGTKSSTQGSSWTQYLAPIRSPKIQQLEKCHSSPVIEEGREQHNAKTLAPVKCSLNETLLLRGL